MLLMLGVAPVVHCELISSHMASSALTYIHSLTLWHGQVAR